MPKCYDCGKELPVLQSIARINPNTGKLESVALCNECVSVSECLK